MSDPIKMDKKVLICFSLFALLMIGGALVLSLWVFPNYLIPYDPYNNPDSTAGMIGSQSTADSSSTDHRSRNEKKLGLIITQMLTGIGAICIVTHVAIRLKRRYRQDRPLSIQGYLFKISRLTGKSEYDIFCKAAEDWPVSGEQIEQDFKRYVSDQRLPYYVNDFVRRNKKHIDALRISIFKRSWYKNDI